MCDHTNMCGENGTSNVQCIGILHTVGKPPKGQVFRHCEELEVEAYSVRTLVDFHVMPTVLGAYPIILGRPWLHAINTIQD